MKAAALILLLTACLAAKPAHAQFVIPPDQFEAWARSAGDTTAFGVTTTTVLQNNVGVLRPLPASGGLSVSQWRLRVVNTIIFRGSENFVNVMEVYVRNVATASVRNADLLLSQPYVSTPAWAHVHARLVEARSDAVALAAQWSTLARLIRDPIEALFGIVKCNGFQCTEAEMRTMVVTAVTAIEMALPSAPSRFQQLAQSFYAAADAVPDATIEELAAMIASSSLPNGLATALTAQLEAALASRDAGNERAHTGQLEAFIRTVEAHLGRTIDEALALELTGIAQALIDAGLP